MSQVISESFEYVDGRMPEDAYTKVSPGEPNGSGELKMTTYCQRFGAATIMRVSDHYRSVLTSKCRPSHHLHSQLHTPCDAACRYVLTWLT